MAGLKHLTTSCASLFNIISHLCLLDCHPVSCIFWIAILCLLDCHAVGTVFSGEPILYSSLFHCHPYSADWEPAVHDEMCCRVLEMVVLFCTFNTISRLMQIPIEYFLKHDKYSFTLPLASVY